MSSGFSAMSAARAALLAVTLLAPLAACAEAGFDRVAGPPMAGAQASPVGSSHYDGGPDPYNVRPSAGLNGIGG